MSCQLTNEIVTEASTAYDHADASYERVNDGDGRAETCYQRAMIAEYLGPHHYAGANIFYRNAVGKATSKKSYYQSKWDEFRKRSGV